ncbi:hypothetical protein COHA_004019 [Chlorella ohadii]|uniref:Uncharacterized protein n=1 Tax=Chlorella ohadii TaxID=2649997 RepID=A0AAD5DR14_9CHLO|nr:hypothetical protein COHA_004019 [Chlorella ohadii]
MVSGRTVAALLLCSLALGASWEAGEAADLRPARQLLQSGFFEPGVSGGGGGWGGGRRRGGGAASATCQGDAEGLLPDAKTEIQQAVAKAFQQCTLVPCRPEASGVAPVIAEAVAPVLVAAANDALYSTACSDEPDSVASQLANAYQQAVGNSCGSDAGSDAASSMADLLSSASQVAGESLFAYCEDLECAASDLADGLEDPIAQNLADALDACLEAGPAQGPAPAPEQAAAPAPEAEQAAVPPPAPEAPAPAPAPVAELPLPGPFGVVALPTPGGLPPAPEMPAVDATSMPAPSFGLQPTSAPAPEPEIAATNATNGTRAAAAGPIADVLQQRLAIGNP